MREVGVLSVEQEAVRDLGVAGRFLVTGPPGTGKSLLAMLRASKIFRLNAKQGGDLVVLSKNKPLNQHLKESIAPALQKLDSEMSAALVGDKLISTYDSWAKALWSRWPKVFDKKGPIRPGLSPKQAQFGWDWDVAKNDVLSKYPIDQERAREALLVPSNVVIDEGQDLPRAFYEFLSILDCNITVFADENQMVFSGMSKIDVIRESLGIDLEDGHLYEVKTNFRNTRQVAEVSSEFYAGLQTGKPELPNRNGQRALIRGFRDLNDLATDIARQSVRQKGKAAKTGPSVGVVVMGGKDKWSRERIERELMQSILKADESAIVRRYDWKTYKGEGKFTFDEPETITIVNAFTQKGLEWDHVYVYVDGFELEPSETENVIQLMQLYVATSRPREKLCIAWTMANFRGRGAPEIVRRFLEQPLRQKIVEDWNE